MKFIILAFLTIAVLGGFFLTLNSIKDLRSDVKGLDLSVQLLGKNSGLDSNIISESSSTSTGVSEEETAKEMTEPEEDKTVTIPTAIIFNAESSPALQPQTNVAVIFESISKDELGKIVLTIKTFTNEASSYSALEARDLFEIVDLQGVNRRPTSVTGSFNSLPPKSVVRGVVEFSGKPSEEIIIIQINSGKEVKHYEFDFKKKTYKETVLG